LQERHPHTFMDLKCEYDEKTSEFVLTNLTYEARGSIVYILDALEELGYDAEQRRTS